MDKFPSAQLTFMDFARIALGLDKAKRGTRTCIISGSFPLDVNKQTQQQTCASTPNPPRSLGFHVLYMRYARLHTPRMSLLSDVVVLRAPRSPRSLFFPLSLVCFCLSVTIPNVFISNKHPTAFLSHPIYLIIIIKIILLQISDIGFVSPPRCALTRSAGCARPSGDDRGCVSWAPMGGSTVP